MADEPVVVPPTPISQQVKGQVRLVLAALAGALVSKYALPAGIVTDQLLDVACAALFAGGAMVWSWVSNRLTHSKLFTIANDVRVPDSVARIEEKPS